MSIITYYIQSNTLFTSEGVKTERILDQLIKDSRSIQCFYDLDHAVSSLCRALHLTLEEITNLWREGSIVWNSHLITYFPKSFLSVERGKTRCLVSDMSQYMPTKIEISEDAGIFYKLAESQNVAHQVYDALTRLGMKPTLLTSPIKTLQKEVLEKMNLPTISDVPDEAGKMFYECCTGGWVDCFKKGYFSKVYDWDIISAYASQLRNLIDFRGAEFKQVKKIPEDLRAFGAFNVIVDTDADLHPLVCTSKPRNMMLNGKFESTLRLEKIRFLYERKLGTVKVLDGWTYMPKTDKKPLQMMIDRLYARKSVGQGMDREIPKRLINGLWGKMGEVFKNGEFGPMANTLWASEVESNIYLKDAAFCLDHNFIPICITTDGVVTDKDLNIPSGTGMGEWKLNQITEALVIGAGQVALKGKQGKGDFSLDFDKLMGMIKETPDTDTLTLERDGYVSIGEAITQKCFDRLGDVTIDKRKINLHGNDKQCFVEEPETFGQLATNQYNSIPWDSSFLEGIK